MPDMRYRPLGSSGLMVSVVGLGANNFGRRIEAAGSRLVIDAALEEGISFIDTADIYGDQGGSEAIIGQALEGRRGRGRDRHYGGRGHGARLTERTWALAGRADTSAGPSKAHLTACGPTAWTSTEYHFPGPGHADRGRP